MQLHVLLVLLFCKLTLASDSLPINVVDGVTVRELGSSVVLPCWISPPLDVSAMEVRWYRQNKFNTPVLLYLNQKFITDNVEKDYRDRSSLTTREPQSAGLKAGDVSLKLDNVTIEDAGIFFCYVSSDKGYNAKNTTLSVTVLGSSPVISLQPVDGQVNVSCSSCGWYPQPTVQWRSERASPLRPGGLVYRQEMGGLSCVHSWVLLSPSDPRSASCSIFITAGEEREGTVDFQGIAQLTEGGAGPWKGLFAAAVFLALAMIGVSVFLYTKYKPGYNRTNTGYNRTNTDEEDGCLSGRTLGKDAVFFSSVGHCNDMSALKKCAVDITLNHEEDYLGLLIIKGNIVRDDPSAAANFRGPGFPYHLSIPATTKFTNGRSYWEVKLTSPNTKTKQSWLIGVQKASNSTIKSTNTKAELVPSRGFWFLYSDGRHGIHVNTETETMLSKHQSPEVVGVLLDYDKGELSFYNAEEGLHLCTIKTQFSGEIVPIFNPGIGDEAPLTIINVTKSSTTNSSSTEPPGGASDQVKTNKSQDEKNTLNDKITN